MNTKIPRPAKILYVCPSQGAYGGMEIAVLNQAKWMHANDSRFEVEIFFKLLAGYKPKGEFIDIINATSFKCQWGPGYSSKLLQLIQRADIVHIQNIPIDAALMASIFNKPLIATIYHQGYSRSIAISSGWRLLAICAKYRIFISDFVRNVWENGFLPINELVSFSWPTLPGTPQLTSPGSSRKGFIFISRWIENKGVEELLEAYRLADIKHTEWPLKMVGTGPLRDFVQDYVKRHSLSTVEVVGFVSENKKWDLLAKSKWLVAPPKTNEDLGLTPIEARYLGIPSIITTDGGLPEAAGPSALKCSPGDVDGLKHLLERAANMDEHSYKNRSQTGLEELKKFLKPMDTYAALYTSIANDFMMI